MIVEHLNININFYELYVFIFQFFTGILELDEYLHGRYCIAKNY